AATVAGGGGGMGANGEHVPLLPFRRHDLDLSTSREECVGGAADVRRCGAVPFHGGCAEPRAATTAKRLAAGCRRQPASRPSEPGIRGVLPGSCPRSTE